MNSNRPKKMDKETFIQQYVLNRALTSGCLNGQGATLEAIKAWEIIRKECD